MRRPVYTTVQNYIPKITSIIKLYIAYVILIFFRRNLYNKRIWLIREKTTEARDNGYHFFKYLREYHPEINAYYAITFDSVDLNKIESYGNIIPINSLKHYIYYLAAKYSINSQPYGAAPDTSRVLHNFSQLRRKDQKVVFLQHGIIKDELSHSFDYEKTKFDLFCCSASRERDFVQQSYLYPKNNVQLLGLCRFDNLVKKGKTPHKQILVMPTFREWLTVMDQTHEATLKEKEVFLTSDFYKTYASLLSDVRLIGTAKKYGYKIVFYPHYSMQPYIRCFEKLASNEVIISDRNHYDVQQLLIESEIMVTDFSSVFFDFAYMKKPEIFFQFDEEQYRSNHYKKGYFNYRSDGFGPVVESIDELVYEVEKIIKNSGNIEKKYMDRIEDFFDVCDDHNCERTYTAIINMR